MKRFFGGKKEAPPPPPSLGDATETVNKRVGVLDDKIKALDKQLIDFKNQLKATRPGYYSTCVHVHVRVILFACTLVRACKRT